MNEYQTMWFVNVVRLVPRKHHFGRWASLKCAIRRARNRGEYTKLLDFWKDYRSECSLGVDVRTWGFYSSKERAIQCVKENWTDIHELYYRYAVVESIKEGVIAEVDEQIFFKWDDFEQGYVQTDYIPAGALESQFMVPAELKKEYDDRQIVFQFTSIG